MSMVVLDWARATDDQLRAEYDRRRLVSPAHAACIEEKLARADAGARAERAEAERDECVRLRNAAEARAERAEAELSKRVRLEEYADEHLRAECERRGFLVAQSNENGDWRGAWDVQVGRNKKIAAERDEWKRRAEAARSQPTEVYAVVQNDWVVAAHELSGKQDGAMLTHERDKAKVFLSSKMIGRIITAAGAEREKRNNAIIAAPADPRRDHERSAVVNVIRGEAFYGDVEHSRGIRALDLRPDNSVAHLDEDLLCEDE